ncbi:hypothetical protein DEO45_07890 [Rhodanobacter denitrificans]|uniref:Lipoprotein n=1 Tax=Rhodanobacter denitrificans TaxID=666685 RepID=A0A368KDJ7_9GAMM|nr:hypothetical protein [Rhodanobacter denitrificans]RCS29990.1 hypothetical protein DEO45_07890 [Rhodanobacter denitrificans]
MRRPDQHPLHSRQPRPRQYHRRAAIAALLAGMLAPALASACSTCGCSLNSDWSSQGYAVSTGLHLSVREDYFDQSRLMHGTGTVGAGTFTYPTDQEVQRKTINHTTLLGADYNFSRYWGLSAQLPYTDRHHQTIASGDTGVSTSDARGIGDLRLLAHYQGFSDDAGLGLQFGVKWPTGRFTQGFAAGPQAGQPLDRGLQLGTGTTDALLGVYKFGYLTDSLAYFSQAMAQIALDARDGFRPGNSLNVDFGVRYLGMRRVTPQLQLNIHGEQRESGRQSDRPNSGATYAYLSPGVSAKLTSRLDAFAFVQLPVWQRVNGLQLEPRRLWSLGVRYRL